ncbi:MAG: hypothetical protein E6Y55_07965 [Klebsiella michiganensis]|nr:hypothetical protein [Klebsiella michiganensis]
MSYGAAIRNQNGAIVVDSNFRHTVFHDKRMPQIIDTGAYDGNMQFGRIRELGYLSPDYEPKPGFLHWFRLTPNTWGFPGAWMFKPGQVEIIRTSRTQALQKGVLNVYSESQELLWSDISSYNMPRIRGFITPSLAVDNNVEAISPGFNPWILLNNCPGNLSDDGSVIGYSGLTFHWDGGTLRYKWERRYQWPFTDVFGGKPILNIPYAIFNYGL